MLFDRGPKSGRVQMRKRPATLAEYHVAGITDAHQQFDYRETTLSHLLRIPHPALAGRTYGQALVDALHLHAHRR